MNRTPPIPERDWSRTVIEAAQRLGWMVAHFRPARTAKGWRTPVAADGAGFPDLVAVRGSRVIFAELKTDRGKLSTDQERWQAVLLFAAEYYVWRPRDWPEVERALKGGAM